MLRYTSALTALWLIVCVAANCGGDDEKKDTTTTKPDTVTPSDTSSADLTTEPDSTTSTDVFSGTLKWYKSCGAPVCGPNITVPANTPACTGDQQEGKLCSQSGATCDAGLGCAAVLICNPFDPRNNSRFGCPISSRKRKRQIRYLSTPALQKLYRETLQLKLATYHYKHDPVDTQRRLGFIIEDAPMSICIDRKREVIDLYAYTSMAVATLQVQATQIETLKRELEALRAELKRIALKK